MQQGIPPLGSLEFASLGARCGNGRQGAGYLLPKAGWAPSRGQQEGAVGQELMPRIELCPAEPSATVSDGHPPSQSADVEVPEPLDVHPCVPQEPKDLAV